MRLVTLWNIGFFPIADFQFRALCRFKSELPSFLWLRNRDVLFQQTNFGLHKEIVMS